MHASILTLIQRIHDTPGQAVMHIAGGGASSIAWLQAVPGCSRTLLRATVPYHPTTLADIIGYPPEHAVSEETALAMAERAFHEATRLAEPGTPAIGVACTSTLATDRSKKGQHRCDVALMTDTAARLHTLVLTKGIRDREAEDDVVSRLVLRTLAEAKGLRVDFDLGLRSDERVESHDIPGISGLRAFLAGEGDALTVLPNGKTLLGIPKVGAVLSGSFNPLHEGHRLLAAVAATELGSEVAFEIPAINAAKPPLTELQIRRRAMQFAGWATLVVTRAPTFAEKTRLFPGRIFVVGVDTARRVLDPSYYEDTIDSMRSALNAVRQAGCRFLVAGRVEEGHFVTVTDIRVPAEFKDLFHAIASAKFRVDISSTDLRRAQGQ